jgi:hypothetical protein
LPGRPGRFSSRRSLWPAASISPTSERIKATFSETEPEGRSAGGPRHQPRANALAVAERHAAIELDARPGAEGRTTSLARIGPGIARIANRERARRLGRSGRDRRRAGPLSADAAARACRRARHGAIATPDVPVAARSGR